MNMQKETPQQFHMMYIANLYNKTSNVVSYLLNIIGDAQGVSISYFKYRQQAKKTYG